MSLTLWAASTCCGIAALLHLASIAVAVLRCRASSRAFVPAWAPPVSVIRPVCGVEPFSEATLASTFALDYQRYEILFCVASANDPIISLVQSLIAAHPHVQARLFMGDDRISANPKLNNVVKGWRAAKHDMIVMADSNVLMPPDYLRRVVASWRPGTGMVSAPPVGSHPLGFWAEVECAFLNAYQARWQYAADSAGMGFAQGKTLCCRRSDMESAGGLGALAAEAAEDAACTKLVRAAGLRVRLVDAPFQQPLGPRTWNEIWGRQIRWARLRRDSFPAFYGMEVAAGAMLPLAAAVTVADAVGYPMTLTVGGFLVVWYGAEALLAAAAGWHLSVLYPIHAIVRDALLPVLWLNGWRGRGFVWRGNAMSVDDPRPAA